MDLDPLKYTQYDSDPPLECDLEQQNPTTLAWEPMDLGGKTVRLLAENRKTHRRFGGTADQLVVAPVDGVSPSRVRYVLQDGDLSEPGDYVYQWEVSAPSGARRTVPPGDSWFEFRVARKLGAVATP